MNKYMPSFAAYLHRRPDAYAVLNGSRSYPEIRGEVYFYTTPVGVIVAVTAEGLPKPTEPCHSPIFALHIHDGAGCYGTPSDPFSGAGMHYDPGGCPHPYHAGDLPPLFGADGYAFGVVLTDRFTVEEIIGKTVVIHSSPDDFTTQPSGNAGARIACGEIISRLRKARW